MTSSEHRRPFPFSLFARKGRRDQREASPQRQEQPRTQVRRPLSYERSLFINYKGRESSLDFNPKAFDEEAAEQLSISQERGYSEADIKYERMQYSLERVWIQAFYGRVPEGWDNWYEPLKAVENMPRGEEFRERDMIDALVLYPDTRIPVAFAARQKLSANSFGELLARNDFTQQEREEMLSGQRALYDSEAEFDQARRAAENSAVQIKAAGAAQKELPVINMSTAESVLLQVLTQDKPLVDVRFVFEDKF